MSVAAIMAAMAVGKGIISVYEEEQARKAQIRGLQGQMGALSNLANITPSEREFVRRRRGIIAGGDPLITDAFQRQIGTIRQQGVFNRQRAQGQVIQQGLENSIVAQELRRKVDKDVLASVAEQARQMALANAEAKRQAELEIEGMNLKTDARKQDVAYKRSVLQAQIGAIPEFNPLLSIAKIGLSGGEAYAGGGGFDDWESLGG